MGWNVSELSLSLAEACGRYRLLVVGTGLVLGVFLLMPILVIVVTSFTSSSFLIFPPHLISLRWYRHVLLSATWHAAFVTSAKTTAGATGVAVCGGTLAALGVRRSGRWAPWLRTVLVAPLIIPVIGYAVGLYLTFGLAGLDGTIWCVMLGQGMLALPLAFITVSGGLANVPSALDRAAESLGAYWPTIVWKVELPLIRSSIMAATLITAVFTFDEVVIAIFLTSPAHPTVPVQIWNSAFQTVSPEITAVGSLVMAGAVLLAVIASLAVNHSRTGGSR